MSRKTENTEIAFSLGNRDVNEARVAQTYGKYCGCPTRDQSAVQPSDVCSAHLGWLRQVRKQVTQQVHQHELHGKDWQKRLPGLFAKNKSCNRIGHGEYTRQQHVQYKPEGRLASYLHDLDSKPYGAEDEEDS